MTLPFYSLNPNYLLGRILFSKELTSKYPTISPT